MGDRRPRRSAALRALWLAFAGLLVCIWAGPAAAERAVILAAASSAHAIDEAIGQFDAGPEDRVVASYAGTSALARQIESGAPADIFLAANAAWMDHVEALGLIEPGSRQALASNRLVFVTGKSDMAPFEPSASLDLGALLDGGRLAIGNPDHVPAGIYARQALEALGLWPRRETASRRQPMYGRRLRWWHGAKRRSASSTRPTPSACRTSTWSRRFRQRFTIRSSTRSPSSRAASHRSRRVSSPSSPGRRAGRHSPAPASSSIEAMSLTPLEVEAIMLSLRVAGWAVLISLPLGIAVAWLLARYRFPGWAVVNGLVHLPLVLPPVVVGFVLLLLLGRQGPLGAWLDDWFGITLAFTWQGAAVASAVVSFPLMVRAIRLSIEGMDRRLETAARTLGAPPVWVFASISLPLMAPGVLTGAILAFARCLGEFGATITFVSNIPGETRTLPLALYTYTQVPGGLDGAFRLMVIAIVIAFAALVGSELLARVLRRRLEG